MTTSCGERPAPRPRWPGAVPYRWLPRPPGRTIVVGDPHGCHDELMALLHELDFSDDDLLIAVGDLVDRGPGTLALLRFFRDRPNAHSVLGNHEHRLAGVLRRTSVGAWSQQQSAMAIPEEERLAWADWIDTLPVVLETPDILVVHGALDPERSAQDQDAFLACTLGGPQVAIPLDSQGVPEWFHRWRDRTRCPLPICIGHLTYTRLDLVPGALYALDGGAAAGGTLAALVLPELRIVTRQVAVNYTATARAAWRRHLLAQLDLRRSPIGEILALETRGEITDAERSLIEECRRGLAELDVEARLRDLQRHIFARFGDRPAPGPERGNWAREVKASLDGLPYSVVKALILERPSGPEEWLQAWRAESLASIDQILDAAACRLATVNTGSHEEGPRESGDP